MLSVFQTELSALRHFIDILQREQAALAKADVAQLTTISSEKIKQAELLSQLGQARVTALAKSGIGADLVAIEAWLARQPRETVAAWNTLIEAAKQAQHINQTNGKLIESQLQNNQQAFNTLIGAANQSAVYGADGQPRTSLPGSQRTLGKG